MPKIGIIVGYNTLVDMTIDCLNSLQKHIQEDEVNTFEVVLINGGCDIDIDHPIVTKKIRYQTNEGTTKMFNHGMREFSDDVDYVTFFSNDGFFTSNKPFQTMIKLLEDKKVAVVCPTPDRPNMVTYKHLVKQETDYGYYCDFFPTITWFFRKKFLEEVGYLDENFKRTAMYMDNDWSLRACKKYGEKCILVSKEVLLHHKLSAETSRMGNQIQEDMQICHEYYRKKWGL